MTQLPAAIEQYLLECGFTSTEILILKHLLAGGSMTLRELAAKTGKSTGVLDSASKKLLKKGILGKEIVNDSPKLTLFSLEAVVAWVHEDSEHTRKSMERREKDLQSFVDSLSPNVSRADIQHFEGMEGMEQAYFKLLEVCGGAMLHFLPVRYTEVDDPLRDFLVQFFRIRRRTGTITRVIAHDTPLGRRYQSRDPFEYRQTLLVPESVYAFNTEKVVAGDWVGTINHNDQKAFLIRSKEMAHTERAMFEALWKQETQKQKEGGGSAAVVLVPKEEEMKTKMVSAMREFFLSRKSLAVFGCVALVSALLTFGSYQYTRTLEFRRMQEAVKSIAATGASQFNPQDLDTLRAEKDWEKPEWQRVVSQLETIRMNNKDLTFVYLFRKTQADPKKMEFIADSHSRNPYANTDEDTSNDVDADNDGVIDPDGHDKLQWPGQPYPDPIEEIFEAYEKPIATRTFYEDEFGRVISGFAPIKDLSGRVAGILGVDMKSELLHERIEDIFKPFVFFLGFFLLLIVVRFGAFNRSLLKEFLSLTQTKTFLLTVSATAIIFLAISYLMYLQTLNLIKDQTAERLKAIAATAAMQINYKDLEPLHFAKDMQRQEYQRVFTVLNNVRKENPDVKWAYVMRPSQQKGMWEFVVDADSNYFLLPANDYDENGIISESEENVYPGFQYDAAYSPNMAIGLEKPFAEKEWYSDQWGTFVSGYAPIIGSGNKGVAIVGFDITAPQVKDNVEMGSLLFLISLLFIIPIFIFLLKDKFQLLKSLFKALIRSK